MNNEQNQLHTIASRLAKLPDAKKRAFREALQEKGIDPWKLPITPTDRTLSKATPLSCAQKRLWLVDQSQHGTKAYIITRDLQLDGTLDVDALRKAFVDIVHRHESLRSCFNGSSGKSVHVTIQNVDQFSVDFLDLSPTNDDEHNGTLAQALAKSRASYFDLSKDYMLRVLLVKLSEDRHVLQVIMHHIASDGASVPILIAEFGALYNAYALSQASPLEPLSIQYPDYAYWQSEWLQSEDFEQKLEFWRKALSNLPPADYLPMDNPRPNHKTFSGGEWISQLSVDTSNRLTEYCQSQNATLFMGLHTILSVLLARYSGEDDIVMGTPVANREQASIGQQIGLLANLLVLRSDVSERSSFETMLQQSRTYLLSAYAHQNVPFETLVEALQADSDDVHSNLFQVVLVLQNNKVENTVTGLHNLACKYLEHKIPLAKYDLRVQVSLRRGGLFLVWDYNSDLFNQSTIKWLADSFNILLCAMLEQPKASVHEVCALSNKYRNQLAYYEHELPMASKPAAMMMGEG
ncbi:MAG: hypothetical protein JKX81_19215 [Arenicella sp.]|nr:hypothetical protein [Arenicella sp.]